MNKKITISRVNPSSVAKVISLTAGAMIAFAIVLQLIVAAIGFSIVPEMSSMSMGGAGWAIAIAPFFYAIGVYFVVFVFCLAYNLVSGWFGGVTVEYSD